MKWLTINDIKKQLRIDHDYEDDVLDLYGSAAEDAVLNYLNRSYQELLENYGEVPPAVRQATLLLVSQSYTAREPASQYNMAPTPYTFDLLIKPYMCLTGGVGKCGVPQVFTIGSQFKILIAADLPDDLEMIDVDFTVTVYNDDKKDKQKEYQKAECILTDNGDYVVLVDSSNLGVGAYMCKVVFLIPDTDFPSGYRKGVIKINPNVKVTG